MLKWRLDRFSTTYILVFFSKMFCILKNVFMTKVIFFKEFKNFV